MFLRRHCGGSRAGGRLEKEKKKKHNKISISVHQWVHGENYILFNVFGEEKKKSVDCVCLKCLCSVLFVQSILSKMKYIYIFGGKKYSAFLFSILNVSLIDDDEYYVFVWGFLLVCFLKSVQSFGNTQCLFVSETETILLFTASRFSV